MWTSVTLTSTILFILVPFSPSFILLFHRNAPHLLHWQMDPEGMGDWQASCDAEYTCTQPYTQMQMIGRRDISLWHPNDFLSPCLIGRVLPLFKTCALSLLANNRQRLARRKQMPSYECLHILKREIMFRDLSSLFDQFPKYKHMNSKQIFLQWSLFNIKQMDANKGWKYFGNKS